MWDEVYGAPPFEAKSDIASQILEFLHDLRPDDILTELVQNELDQRATTTRIEITPTGLVAEGDGDPVDADGWKRLSMMLAAGVIVPAKRDGIGVKNHGLRASFYLGDLIIVRSAGKQTRLTLRNAGPRGPLDPGAWPYPVADATAPLRGCRIEVPFRTSRLKVKGGEGIDLAKPTEAMIEAIFRATCEQAPFRFLGCFRPGYLTRYTLHLTHWKLGTYTFSYSVRPARSAGRIRIYRRSCHVRTPAGTSAVFEDAFLYSPPKPLRLDRRVPSFYRSTNGRTLVEVSWPVTRSGHPIPNSGRFRYPIGYSGDAENARTSIGANISAPFVSEILRHGIAAAEHTQKDELIAAGEAAILKALREHLVPRFGPAALIVLEDPERRRSPRMERLVLGAAEEGALPAAPVRDKGRGRPSFRCVPPSRDGDCAFLIPAFTWMRTSTSPLLAKIAPREYPQLHPACPETVVGVLFDTWHSHIGGPLITFDEADAVARLQPEKTGPFPWSSPEAAKRELRDPRTARLYLDVIAQASAHGSLTKEQENALKSKGVLPDHTGDVSPWSSLYRARKRIDPVPGVAEAPRVHPLLADHRILEKGALKLKPYVIDEYISDLDFEKVIASGRNAFFEWIVHNYQLLKGATLKDEVADYPIWRTTSGQFVRFADLCLPDEQLRSILRGYVREPDPKILRIKGVRRDGHGLLKLRKLPNESELKAWYSARLAALPLDRVLTSVEVEAFRKFESELVTLWESADLRSRMASFSSAHPALNEMGVLRPVHELHARTEAVVHCRLRPEDMMAEGTPASIVADFGARRHSSAEAIVRALEEDAGATEVLYPRLTAYCAAIKGEDEPVDEIRDLAFLPIDGRMYPPSAVALRGSKDFWGRWKVKLDTRELSADRQDYLKTVGVTPGTPTEKTSREFFEWLAEQTPDLQVAHLDQVIRHFLHPARPLRWWHHHPNLPCLPVYVHGKEVRIVSRRSALAGTPVILPDFPALEDLILKKDRRRRIVITDTSATNEAITDGLLELGLKTVRQLVLPPVSVAGVGRAVAYDELMPHVVRLGSSKMAGELKKRLQEQKVAASDLRTQWRNEVRRITAVRRARTVVADYELGGHRYQLRVPSGVDQETGVLWVDENVVDPVAALYAAIAERIFDPASPPFYPHVLRAAAESRFESRFRSQQIEISDVVDEDEESCEPGTEEPTEATEPRVDRVNELNKTHHAPSPIEDDVPTLEPFTPDEITPNRLGTGSDENGRRPLRKLGGIRKDRVEDPKERSAIKKLKSGQYRWHCQVCLAEHAPTLLAPSSSYAAQPGHRRAFMHAHHVDQVHGDGARSIANIIVLCKHHHGMLGDKLSRAIVRQAMDAHAEEAVVVFPRLEEGKAKTISGLRLTVSLDSEPFEVPIFFTNEHARVWREAKINEGVPAG